METPDQSSQERNAMQTTVCVQLMAPGEALRSLLLPPNNAPHSCEPQSLLVLRKSLTRIHQLLHDGPSECSTEPKLSLRPPSSRSPPSTSPFMSWPRLLCSCLRTHRHAQVPFATSLPALALASLLPPPPYPCQPSKPLTQTPFTILRSLL